MKKIILAAVAVVVLGGTAGGYVLYRRHGDPLANARAALARGDLRAAQLDLRSAVRDDPGNAEAHFRLAGTQLQLGDPVAAEKELKAAAARGYRPDDVAQLLARAYLAQGKFKELLDQVPEGNRAPAAEAVVRVMRGNAQSGLRQVEAAQASFAAAERLDPKNADAPAAAAAVSALSGDPAAADRQIDAALAIQPDRADVLLLRAEMKRRDGDDAAAMAALDQAIAKNPGTIAARVLRADMLMGRGEDAKAKADVDALLAEEPRNVMAMMLRGALQVRARDYAGADATFQTLSPVIDRLPRGYYFQAIAKLELGQLEQARDAASKFMARNPGELDAAKLLARVELTARRPDPAIEALRPFATGPSAADPDVGDLLGRAYAMAGRTQDAVRSFEQAVAAPTPPDPIMRTASPGAPGQPATAQADAGSPATPPAARSAAQVNAQEALIANALAAGDTDRASAALDKLRAQIGETEAVGNLGGLVKLARFDLSGAETQFRAMLAKYPDSVFTKLNLARVLALRSQNDEVLTLLGGILARQPANEAALGGALPILLQTGQLPRAVAMLEAAHAATPANTGFTAALSDLYVQSKQPKKSIDLLDQAQAGQAATPALIAARARAQIALGQAGEARDNFRRIIEMDPSSNPARGSLADLLVEAGDRDAARAVLMDGLKVKPGDPALMQAVLALANASGGADAALAAAETLRADPVNLPGARVLKGDVLMSARRFDDAVTAFAAEQKASPSGVLAMRLAGAQAAAGHEDQAAATLRDWLAKSPDDIAVVQGLASEDLAAGRYDAAEKGFAAVVARQPNAAGALNNLAWLYQRRGDPRARGLAQKAYVLAPTPQLADTLGWILTSDGDVANGLVLLKQAGAQLKDDPSVTYHLAYALDRSGDRDGAVAVLKPLVEGNAKFDERADAGKLLETLSKPK